MAESSAGDFTVGKIQKTRRQRVAKMYGQQKRNIIHMSSTAYEQDHSAAAPPSMPTRTSEDVAEANIQIAKQLRQRSVCHGLPVWTTAG
jgi:ribosome maturation protein Sdo1